MKLLIKKYSSSCSLLLAALFLVSCQSSTPAPKQLTAAPLKPIPSWANLKKQPKAKKNAQQVKIEVKLIEKTYRPGATDIPTKLSRKHLTKDQIQKLLRTLAQRKDTDILQSQTVVAQEGAIATIQVVAGPKTEGSGVFQTYLVHPSKSGKKIRLNALLQVKEFLGYETGKSTPAQPVFEERRLDEVVSLTSGHSVLFSGLVADKQNKIKDQVPLLGYIPLIGNLFTRESTLNYKSEVMLLITATKIDATGRPN